MWIFFPFKHSMLSEWKKKIRWLMAIFSIFDFRFSSYEQVLWVYSFIPFSSNNVPQWFIFYIGLAKTKTKQKKQVGKKLAYCSHIPFSWTTITTKSIKWNMDSFSPKCQLQLQLQITLQQLIFLCLELLLQKQMF